MRIAILGSSGSGKSTLAKGLADRYGVPLLYLDTVNFESGWRERSDEEKVRAVARFMENSGWVIEGNYEKLLLEERLGRADMVLILGFGRWVCVSGALKRWFRYRGTVRESMSDGCVERLDPEFLRWVAFGQFSSGREARILSIAERYPEKTHVFRTRRELESFLESVLRQDVT